MELRVHVNERMGKDVSLDSIGFKFEGGCWRMLYHPTPFVEAMWVLKKHFPDLPTKKPLVVVYNDGNFTELKYSLTSRVI